MDELMPGSEAIATSVKLMKAAPAPADQLDVPWEAIHTDHSSAVVVLDGDLVIEYARDGDELEFHLPIGDVFRALAGADPNEFTPVVFG